MILLIKSGIVHHGSLGRSNHFKIREYCTSKESLLKISFELLLNCCVVPSILNEGATMATTHLQKKCAAMNY